MTSWTEERTAQLRQMHAEGFSFSQIAAQLGGISRNAVIGKAQRINLPLRGAGRTGHMKEPLHRQRKNKPRKYNYRPTIQIFAENLACDLPADQPDNPLSLFELASTSCRWPCTGEGSAVVFCGGDAIKDHAYCLRHCRIAYRRPEPKQVAA